MLQCKRENDILTAPEGKNLYSTVHAMYIRPHYKNILDLIELNTIVAPDKQLIYLLTGTPGIGKSLFAVYLIHTIMTTNDYPNITQILYRRNMFKGDTFLAFQRGDSVWVQAPPSKSFTPQLFINDDSHGTYRGISGAINILISSPRVRACTRNKSNLTKAPPPFFSCFSRSASKPKAWHLPTRRSILTSLCQFGLCRNY